MTYSAGTPERRVVYAFADDIQAKDVEIGRLRAILEQVWNDSDVVDHLTQDTREAICAALGNQQGTQPK